MKSIQRKPRFPEGPRRAAWQILLAWESGSSALEAIRDNHFKQSKYDFRDRALITELTQGTTRHLLFLDHTIQNYLDRPDLTLPKPVIIALRLGAYQLIHLHKIPAHAAVKETVQIVKDSRYRRFSSLVNAVLRKIAGKGPAPIPSFSDDPEKHIEIATSTPRWLIQRLAKDRGLKETLRILQALNHTPPITLRVNTLITSRDRLLELLMKHGAAAVPGRICTDALILEHRFPVGELTPLTEGLCTVQDEGAQLIAGLLKPHPELKILDACAAPGGKTSHLAQLVSDHGFIIAADKSHKRLRMMTGNLKRLKINCVKSVAADLALNESPFKKNVFDRTLLDAPCSGTGVLRRHPEGKWKKDPETIDRMTKMQEDLLTSAAHSLKEGGRLLYTTCSLLEEENEKVVDHFLSASPGMTRLDLRKMFPDLRQDIFSDRGELRLWPHLHDCDGFYACLMEKKFDV